MSFDFCIRPLRSFFDKILKIGFVFHGKIFVIFNGFYFGIQSFTFFQGGKFARSI